MKFTILTEPVGMYYNLRTMAKRVLGRDQGYGGHYGVTRSLIQGLEKNNCDLYNYRPASEKDIYNNVHVLAGVKTLKYAIDLKKKGRIKHLTAGPNIVTFSTDAEGIVCDEAIEMFMQPSDWAVEMFTNMTPQLEGRCISWAAGVDLEKYSFARNSNTKKVLIYYKEGSEQLFFRLRYIIRKYGYEPITIRYGEYKLNDYLAALSESVFMVSISRQESQGLFLAEAWSLDVPTICYDPHYYHWPYEYIDVDIEGNISTCPYLSDETGVRFETIEEFISILDNWATISTYFNPRKWVKANMTDEVCAKKFLDIVRNIYE